MAIYKTKTGYRIRYYDADGIERKKTIRGITRDEACKLEREILAVRDRGERLPDPRTAPHFKGFADLWVEENRVQWKLSTLWQYEQVIKSQLTPCFGEVRLSNITESKIRKALTSLSDNGLGPRRINLVLGVLRQIVRAGKRKGYLRQDPTAEIRDFKEPTPDIDLLDPQEIESFLSHCPAWWQPYFTVAFWTGSRPNELAALKWGDLDENRSSFRIRAGRYRGVEGTPKTASSVRDVDMLSPVLKAFQAQKSQQAKFRLHKGKGSLEAGSDYVFTGAGGGFLNMNYLRERVWNPTLAVAGLRRRTMYQTRHSFASNALAAGESPTWVAAMLGHKTPEMVFKVYSRFIPNRTRRDGSALLLHLNRVKEGLSIEAEALNK